MQNRFLGSSAISVAPLALGGNVFGWTTDEATSFRILDEFVDAGFNLIDTADVYSRWAPGNKGGESETILGKWFKKSGKRDRVILATKVGKEMAPDKKGLSAKYIRGAVEDSLKRLQTDRIDLYQSHDDDPHTPLEETMGAFAELITSGKIRITGASNYGVPRLREALDICQQHGLPRYETLQPLYNLYDREAFEKELQPFCVANQVSVIGFYSLASGFLTGKYRSEDDLAKSVRGQGNKKYLNERGFRILKALDESARRYQVSPACIALAWTMAQPAVAAPIASATSIAQLKELMQAASLNLDPGTLELLNQASAW